MRKPKKLLSLLATAATAATVTACAGARTTAPRAPVATAVVLGAAAEVPAEAPTPPVDTVTPLAPAIVVDTPLVGASGRPACGNVQTKSDESMRDCDNLASR
jgi:hypothetical protein